MQECQQCPHKQKQIERRKMIKINSEKYKNTKLDLIKANKNYENCFGIFWNYENSK
jgi:hypothetical protein